jgi:NADH dehydrogenase
VEAIAELRDLAHRVLRFFPTLEPGDLRFVLVHSGARVLPSSAPSSPPSRRGTCARAACRSCSGPASHGRARTRWSLRTRGEILARTIVWTAGNRPSGLVGDAPARALAPGALVVDQTLRVPTGEPVVGGGGLRRRARRRGRTPPADGAARATRGQGAGDNLAAVLIGADAAAPALHDARRARPRSGSEAGSPRSAACCFSGSIAWALWRAVYLVKLPGLEKRVRVALDWLLDIAFPRDIVLPDRMGPGRSTRADARARAARRGVSARRSTW